LYLAWLERDSYQFNLWAAKYLLLDPADVIQFVYDSITFRARVVEANVGQGFAVEVKSVSDAADNYLSNAAPAINQGTTAPNGAGGAGSGTVNNGGLPRVIPTTVLWILDIPLLLNTDVAPGFYFAMGSGSPDWPGAILNRSVDGTTFAAID